ncbi:MAG TPA: PQQ-binding-like beta-propeller repeat protein [Gemmata sp.]
MSRFALFAVLLVAATGPVAAAPVPKEPTGRPWSMFGGTPARNMANRTEKLPALPREGPDWTRADAAKTWEAEWVLWSAPLGSRCNSSPIVAGGKVFVGTNNQQPRNARDMRLVKGGPPEPLDKGVLMCFDERTGQFLWQAVHDMLPAGGVNNWPREGVCSAPAVIGDRVYYVSNQCRVVCLDANGFANGNQGIQTEKYRDKTDADIIWEYDMIRELDVFPHCVANGSPLVVGDRIFVCTSNGVDESHINIPSPNAPSLICLDRSTGKLLWKDSSPGKNVMHGQWSSPAYSADPVPQVIQGQGDGWLRGFDAATGKLLWKFDGNRKGATFDIGGTGEKSDFLATPVVDGGRVFIGTGQDPEHSAGPGNLWCIDLKKAVDLGAKADGRDVSPDLVVKVERNPGGADKVVTKANPASALAWVFGGQETRKWAPLDFKFGRTLSTVAVVDEVVYAADILGHVHCLSAQTGEPFWQYDTRASIWGSPYCVDGKVLLCTDAGDLFAFKHTAKPPRFDALDAAKGAANRREARATFKDVRAQVEKACLLARVELPSTIRSTPVVANGVLFVATENTLYAIRKR